MSNILIPDHNYDMKCFVSFEKHTFNQHCFFRVIFMLLLLSEDIYQNLFLKKILSGTLERQTVQIQIRTDNMSVLI